MWIYPSGILLLDETGSRFKITPEAGYLLSLVSGIPARSIAETVIYCRFSRFKLVPWYRVASTGGGAITLGNYLTKRIVLAENYFSADAAKFRSVYDADQSFAYGNDHYAWLRLLAHEVRHIAHIERFNNWFLYIAYFFLQYIKYRSHAAVPEEVWAEQGSLNFDEFSSFCDSRNGRSSLVKLLIAEDSQGSKIIQISAWYREFTPL